VLNYFNYFTEIEERFQQRRGALLLLSTLDWALIETWREAGIPLEAALRGIDAAFDKYEARQKRGRMQRVNGLAWCAQAVMVAAEELREAAAGTAPGATIVARESGFEEERVAAHLEAAATALDGLNTAFTSSTMKTALDNLGKFLASPQFVKMMSDIGQIAGFLAALVILSPAYIAEAVTGTTPGQMNPTSAYNTNGPGSMYTAFGGKDKEGTNYGAPLPAESPTGFEKEIPQTF